MVKIILVLTSIMSIGFGISVLALKIRDWPRLIILSLVFGSIVYIFFLNLTSFLIPLRYNFFISLSLLSAASLLSLYLKRKNLFFETFKFKELSWKKVLFAGIFVIFFLVNFIFLAFRYNFDHPWNWSVSSLLASGNFPLNDPFFTADKIAVGYHYAYNLFVASFVNLADFNTVFASTFATILISIIATGMIWLFIYSLINKNFYWSLILTSIFYLLAGLKFVTFFFTPFLPYQLDWQIPIKENWIWFVYGNVFNPFFLSVGNGTVMVTMICILSIIFISRSNIGNTIKLFFVSVCFAVLALSSETVFVPFFLVYCSVMLCVHFKKKVYRTLLPFFIFIFVTLAVVSLQGGILTTQVAGMLSRGEQSQQAIGFKLRTIPAMPLMCDIDCPPQSLFKIDGWKLVFVEYGLIVVFIPFLGYFFYKKKDIYLFILFLTGSLSTLIPLFISYPINEKDLSRFSAQGIWFFNILFLIYIYYFIKEHKLNLIGKIGCAAVVTIMITQGIAFDLYNFVSEIKHPESFSQFKKMDSGGFWEKEDEIMFKEFFGRDLIRQKIIYSVAPERTIVTFSGFVPLIYQEEFLTQHNSAAVAQFVDNVKKIDAVFSVDNLKKLKVDFVYLTPRLQEKLVKENNKILADSKNFLLIKEVGSDDTYRALYQLIY